MEKGNKPTKKKGTNKSKRRIIIVVGSIGSGKSEASGYIKSKGIPMFRTGDVIRGEVIRRGLTLNPKNSEMIARRYREEKGMDIAARMVWEQIRKLSPKKYPIVCVEGPRDMYEISYLAGHADIVMLVIDAPLVLRFRRAKHRKGSHLEPKTRDANDFKEFKWRDDSENERGQKDVINTKKYPRFVIDNSGTKQELHENIDDIISGMKESAADVSKPNKTRRKKAG
jgi:dephospho-CoA kinase